MKLFAIAIAFVSAAAFANPPAGSTTTTTTTPPAAGSETTTTAPHGKAHKMKKTTVKETTETATKACTKEDEAAGKCKMETTK